MQPAAGTNISGDSTVDNSRRGVVIVNSSATIIAAIIAKAGARGTLYPVLSFPILIPLLMTVMNATTRALAGEPFINAIGELQVLVGYLLVMVGGSYLLFDFVWKD